MHGWASFFLHHLSFFFKLVLQVWCEGFSLPLFFTFFHIGRSLLCFSLLSTGIRIHVGYENEGEREEEKRRERGAYFGKNYSKFIDCLDLRRGAAMGVGLDSQAKGRQTYPDS